MEDNIPPVIQQILYSDKKITIIFDTCIENDDTLDYYTTCLQSFFGITNIKWRDDQEVDIYTNSVKFTNIITDNQPLQKDNTLGCALRQICNNYRKNEKDKEHERISKLRTDFINNKVIKYTNELISHCTEVAKHGGTSISFIYIDDPCTDDLFQSMMDSLGLFFTFIKGADQLKLKPIPSLTIDNKLISINIIPKYRFVKIHWDLNDV